MGLMIRPSELSNGWLGMSNPAAYPVFRSVISAGVPVDCSVGATGQKSSCLARRVV